MAAASSTAEGGPSSLKAAVTDSGKMDSVQHLSSTSGGTATPPIPAATLPPTSIAPQQSPTPSYHYPPSPYGMHPHAYPFHNPQYGYHHPHFFYPPPPPPPPPPPHQYQWQYPRPDMPPHSDQASANPSQSSSTQVSNSGHPTHHHLPSFVSYAPYPHSHPYSTFPSTDSSGAAASLDLGTAVNSTASATGATAASTSSSTLPRAPGSNAPPSFISQQHFSSAPPFAFYGPYPTPMPYPHPTAANAPVPAPVPAPAAPAAAAAAADIVDAAGAAAAATVGDGGATTIATQALTSLQEQGVSAHSSLEMVGNAGGHGDTGLGRGSCIRTSAIGSGTGDKESRLPSVQTRGGSIDVNTGVNAAAGSDCRVAGVESKAAACVGAEEHVSGMTNATAGTDITEACTDGHGGEGIIHVVHTGAGTCTSNRGSIHGNPCVGQVSGMGVSLSAPATAGLSDVVNPANVALSPPSSPPIAGAKRKLAVVLPHASPSPVQSAAPHPGHRGDKNTTPPSSSIQLPNNIVADSKRGRKLKPLDELHPTSIFRRRQRMLRQIKEIAAEFVGKVVDDLTTKDLSDTLLFALGSKTLMEVDAAYIVALVKDRRAAADGRRSSVTKRKRQTSYSVDRHGTTATPSSRPEYSGLRQRRRDKVNCNESTSLNRMGDSMEHRMENGAAEEGTDEELPGIQAAEHKLTKKMQALLGEAGLRLDDADLYGSGPHMHHSISDDDNKGRLLEGTGSGAAQDSGDVDDHVRTASLEVVVEKARSRAGTRRRYTDGTKVRAPTKRAKEREILETNEDANDRGGGGGGGAGGGNERRGVRRKSRGGVRVRGTNAGGGRTGQRIGGTAGRYGENRSKRGKEGWEGHKMEVMESEEVEFLGERLVKGAKRVAMRGREGVARGMRDLVDVRRIDARMDGSGAEGGRQLMGKVQGLRSRGRKIDDDAARGMGEAEDGRLATERKEGRMGGEELPLVLHRGDGKMNEVEEKGGREDVGNQRLGVVEEGKPEGAVSGMDSMAEYGMLLLDCSAHRRADAGFLNLG